MESLVDIYDLQPLYKKYGKASTELNANIFARDVSDALPITVFKNDQKHQWNIDVPILEFYWNVQSLTLLHHFSIAAGLIDLKFGAKPREYITG